MALSSLLPFSVGAAEKRRERHKKRALQEHLGHHSGRDAAHLHDLLDLRLRHGRRRLPRLQFVELLRFFVVFRFSNCSIALSVDSCHNVRFHSKLSSNELLTRSTERLATAGEDAVSSCS